jgi:hypothetical protein
MGFVVVYMAFTPVYLRRGEKKHCRRPVRLQVTTDQGGEGHMAAQWRAGIETGLQVLC